MRKILWLALFAGCFAPKFENGKTPCKANSDCPSGLHCAADQKCWKIGVEPDSDMAMHVDEDGGADLAMGDGASADLLNVDLTPPAKHQGESCGAGDTCESGHCVDGYCCDTDCNNTCQACNIAGSLGICSNVSAGQNPAGTRNCNAQAASSCGRDGKCDGEGNCRDFPAGTVCVAGTCDVGASDNFTNPSTCNGSGTCVGNNGGNCAPYKCQDATQCWSICTTGDNTHCSGANVCAANSCGQLPNGRLCGTNGAQCTSGKCVDGYCCNADCTDSCQACNVPGNFGACTTLTNNSTPVGTRMCTNLNSSPCGGKCNGLVSTCFYAPPSTPCGATCMGVQIKKSFCDMNGSCIAQAPANCVNNFICSGSACLSTCNNNAECTPSATYGCGNADNHCHNFCVFDTDTFDNDGCIYAP